MENEPVEVIQDFFDATYWNQSTWFPSWTGY